MMDELSETAVQSALSTKWVGRTYRPFASVGSTNLLLKAEIAAGDGHTPPAGTVFLADYQEQGRGRMQQRWLAPAGSSLLLSVLFRPDWPAQQAQWLTMLASLAVAEAVEAVTGLTLGVKWPNDVMIERSGVGHKLCGLLLEGDVGQNGRLQSAVLGIGINVNIPAAHLPEAITPATSLQVEAGQPVSRLDLLVTLLQHLETRYEQADGGQSPQASWERRLAALGKQVRVTNIDTDWTVTGIVEGIDEWGRLKVRDAAGELHAIAAGDVTLR